MPVCTLQRHVPFSAEQMFDLVIDVERYREFMPFEFDAHVIERSTDSLLSSQALRIGPVPLKFNTSASFHRPDWIRVISTGGPFKYFLIAWSFTSQGQGCDIRARVECTAGSSLLAPLLTPWVEAFTRDLISAFEKRAAETYTRN